MMGRCWSPTAGPTRCSCRASGRGWCAPVAGSSAPVCGLIGRSVKGGEPDGRARPHQRSQDTKARSAPALELETGLHQARGLKVDSRPRSYPSYGYVHPEPRPAILRTPGLPGASRASWFRSGSLPVAPPPQPVWGLAQPRHQRPYAKLISGDEVFAIKGCFVYKTVETIHRSEFCFFYQVNSTQLPNLNFCTVGQGSD